MVKNRPTGARVASGVLWRMIWRRGEVRVRLRTSRYCWRVDVVDGGLKCGEE